MSDEISLQGKVYVSSRRAAEMTGYARDYVGQLAREGNLVAERVGGLWYIEEASIKAYLESTGDYKPEPPKGLQQQGKELESYISFEGKDYISARRASKITGYTQDYVGQLARGGKIVSRQMGNRWYIDRDSILAHKDQKDSLLGAVQAQAVGIPPKTETNIQSSIPRTHEDEPMLKYTSDNADLLPKIAGSEASTSGDSRINPHHVPIRVSHIQPGMPARNSIAGTSKRQQKTPWKMPRSTPLVATVLTIGIVLSIGFVMFKNSSTYVLRGFDIRQALNAQQLSASAASVLNGVGDVLEQWFVPELVYKSSSQ